MGGWWGRWERRKMGSGGGLAGDGWVETEFGSEGCWMGEIGSGSYFYLFFEIYFKK